MMLKHTIFILFLFAGLTISASAASDQVVINSADWQDVYLGSHFASLNDINAKFHECSVKRSMYPSASFYFCWDHFPDL
jgi:hypothetical protein